MDRRSFFRRSIPAVAIAATGLPAIAAALTTEKRDAKGRLIVDGKTVTLEGAALDGGLHITCPSGITVQNCVFTQHAPAPAAMLAIKAHDAD